MTYLFTTPEMNFRMIRITTFLFITLFAVGTAFANGIEFFQGTWDEAKALAKQQGRVIFVDAYTTWCGPCKRMSANVFTKAEVGEFYNQNFVNVKLDMEKGEGKDFQRKYRVTAFPTLLFLDGNGELVHRVVGGMDVNNFMKLGRFVADKAPSVSKELEEAYANGQRDPKFMAEYITVMSKAKRPVIKIANDYLRDQKNLSTDENLTVIYHAAVEADSRIFNMMIDQRKKIEKLFGREAFEDKVVEAANATVQKAIEFRSADLLEEAIDKVDRYASDHAKSFEMNARMKYYIEAREYQAYIDEAKSYVRQGIEQKFEIVSFIFKEMRHEPLLLKQGAEWSVEAAEEEENEQHCFIAAQFMYLMKDYEKSMSLAEKALEFANESKTGAAPYIKRLINTLEQQLKT